MKVRRVACALGLALATVAASPAVASADTSPPPTYYLPLGDSLAAGYQPGGQGDTNQGYANQLFTTLTSGSNNPGLQLQKLGCSGETTTTMLNGGICTYPGTGANSHVEAAVQFLAAHPGQVKYVTIDIGANDVQKCAKGGSIDIPCAVQGIATLAQNLPTILARLKAAGVATNNALTKAVARADRRRPAQRLQHLHTHLRVHAVQGHPRQPQRLRGDRQGVCRRAGCTDYRRVALRVPGVRVAGP